MACTKCGFEGHNRTSCEYSGELLNTRRNLENVLKGYMRETFAFCLIKNVKVAMDTVTIKVEDPDFAYDELKEVSDLLGTTKINISDFSDSEGCSTCGISEKYAKVHCSDVDIQSLKQKLGIC